MPDARNGVLRALLVYDGRWPEQLALAVEATPRAVTRALDRLMANGLVASEAHGTFRLTDDGKAVARAQFARDRETLGPAMVDAAWEVFPTFDDRLKLVISDWQVREEDGQQAPNDHTDAAYDASVLASFAALHVDARVWLECWAAGLPRLAVYLRRLDRAARSVADGEMRYVASPRVDSYHAAWFELEEEVILLAGRTRVDWVAAGND